MDGILFFTRHLWGCANAYPPSVIRNYPRMPFAWYIKCFLLCSTITAKLLDEKSNTWDTVWTLNLFSETNLKNWSRLHWGMLLVILGYLTSSIWSPHCSNASCFHNCSLKGKWFVSISLAVTTGLNPSFGITWSSCTGCQAPSKATEIDDNNSPHSSFVVYTMTLFTLYLTGD